MKPANVKVREDGTVKVLDFGLAKALDQAPKASSPHDLVASPTVTSPAMTHAGIILGTAAYMAPEQARGKAVDRRADIWAFGCVLFEMLCGAAPFHGDSITDVLAAVVRGEPDWQRLPAGTPPAIRRLLRRCLQKDLRARLRDIGDARLELEAGGDESPGITLDGFAARGGVTCWWAAAAGVLALVALALGALLVAGGGTGAVSRGPLSLSVTFPADAQMHVGLPRVALDLAGRPADRVHGCSRRGRTAPVGTRPRSLRGQAAGWHPRRPHGRVLTRWPLGGILR